jgi:2-keto-4-pentenoate hydratase/2-oxohepta-3-ene-1,7-dioic acid hydratase in catechol pathway
VPEVFFKPAQCINNPFDPVVLPSSAPAAIDAEVELAVVIGRECKNVDTSSALDYVLGYTIANDITARDVQARVSQWGYAKGYDGFCPLGPVLVSPKAPGLDVENLDMKTKLDGHVLQDGTSSQMIFSVAEIISYLSKVIVSPKTHQGHSPVMLTRILGYHITGWNLDPDGNTIRYWAQLLATQILEGRVSSTN